MSEHRNRPTLDDFLDEAPPESPALQSEKTINKRRLSGLYALYGAFLLLVAVASFFIGKNALMYEPSAIPTANNELVTAPVDSYGAAGPDYNDNGAYGNESGAEQFGQFEMNDGSTIQFRVKNGKTEYSTDNGKTWSETAPEGMPPIP